MFRKVVSIVVVFSLLSLSFFSCSDETATRPEDLPEVRNAGLGNPGVILSESQEVRDLIDIRNDMIARALASGVSGTELADIVSSNDEERFASVLGYTEDEMNTVGDRIAALGTSLRNRFPQLQAMADYPSPCIACTFDNIAEKWDNLLMADKRSDILLREGEVMLPAPDPNQKGVSCQWVPYTASLSLCTLSGPVFYWACAVVAICTFCSGGWIDTMCQS